MIGGRLNFKASAFGNTRITWFEPLASKLTKYLSVKVNFPLDVGYWAIGSEESLNGRGKLNVLLGINHGPIAGSSNSGPEAEYNWDLFPSNANPWPNLSLLPGVLLIVVRLPSFNRKLSTNGPVS